MFSLSFSESCRCRERNKKPRWWQEGDSQHSFFCCQFLKRNAEDLRKSTINKNKWLPLNLIGSGWETCRCHLSSNIYGIRKFSTSIDLRADNGLFATARLLNGTACHWHRFKYSCLVMICKHSWSSQREAMFIWSSPFTCPLFTTFGLVTNQKVAAFTNIQSQNV